MRPKKTIEVLILILAALLPACSKHLAQALEKKTAKDSFMMYGPMEFYGARSEHVVTDVPYAANEPYSRDLTLDVYWNDHSGKAPIVVNIHGGGWMIGDKQAANSVYRSKYLAARGYVVANVNYRMLPGAPIQTQVEDVMGAVIWMKENAARFGADPCRVGVTGGSAGGHLTVMVAWASDDPYFQPTGHSASAYRADVKAAVPFYAALELEEALGLGNEDLKPWSEAYFTRTARASDRALIFEHISPKNHLSKNIPPTFFICGTQDEFGFYHDALAYRDRLLELGVPTGLYSALGAPHGFDARYGEKYSTEALKATADWFDKYLK